MSDPCECVFNHEAIMRRILSILQDAQADCTDTECATGLGGDPTASSSNMVLIAMAWGLFAMMMFLMRPASMRSGGGSDGGGQLEGKQANSAGGNNNNNDDRGPPPGDVF